MGLGSRARTATASPSLSRKQLIRNCIASVKIELSTAPSRARASISRPEISTVAIARTVWASSGGPSMLRRSPSTRYTGGLPAFRCRSDTRIDPRVAK
jgi:hypothetical protein